MNLLEIEPSVIHLQGITRSSHFKIVNRNDYLSVSFSIMLPNDSITSLKVFPENGILLRGEEQKISVKLLNHQNTSFTSRAEATYRILVRFTYKTQYNKRYLAKNNMSGWNELSEDIFQKSVTIVSGEERQAIQNYIKEQIHFEKTFGTDQLNLSAIKKNQAQEIDNESFMTLNLSSKFDEKKQSKTLLPNILQNENDKSIEVDQIFPLVFGESRAKQEPNMNKKTRCVEEKYDKLVESKLIKEDLNNSFSISMKTAKKDNFSHESSFNNSSENVAKNKTFDLIILAIIAAFFVALGNNLRRIII